VRRGAEYTPDGGSHEFGAFSLSLHRAARATGQ